MNPRDWYPVGDPLSDILVLTTDSPIQPFQTLPPGEFDSFRLPVEGDGHISI